MAGQMLDCRGMVCPRPVVETKKRLAECGGEPLTVLLDNETSKNNIMKLANSLRLEAVARTEPGGYAVTLTKANTPLAKDLQGRSLLITGELLGRGSEELGALLMKSFLYALAESDCLPESVTLLNSAVRLACAGSPVLDSLSKLEAKGVVIQSCGLCLDYYQLKEKTRAGQVTNMYAIVDQLLTEEAIIL